jgi:hypothetical protein
MEPVVVTQISYQGEVAHFPELAFVVFDFVTVHGEKAAKQR